MGGREAIREQEHRLAGEAAFAAGEPTRRGEGMDGSNGNSFSRRKGAA
jgi:hypothetical protein